MSLCTWQPSLLCDLASLLPPHVRPRCARFSVPPAAASTTFRRCAATWPRAWTSVSWAESLGYGDGCGAGLQHVGLLRPAGGMEACPPTDQHVPSERCQSWLNLHACCLHVSLPDRDVLGFIVVKRPQTFDETFEGCWCAPQPLSTWTLGHWMHCLRHVPAHAAADPSCCSAVDADRPPAYNLCTPAPSTAAGCGGTAWACI